MPVIKRDGYVIDYEVSCFSEELPVLILSHPLGSDRGVWEPQRRELDRNFRIVTYDHRGHGMSSLGSGPLDIGQYGDDVIAILDHLNIERAHFCGLSLGGMVGQWLGADRPGRLNSLILANTCARIEDTEILKKRIESLKDGEDLSSIADNVIDVWLSSGFRHRYPKLAEDEKQRLLKSSAQAYISTAEMICAIDLRPILTEVEVPTLVVGGRHDRATPPDWNQAIAAAIPNAKYMEIGTGHLSNVEAPGAFNQLVLSLR